MATYAYARVSARDQRLVRQLKAFADYGIDGKNIYADQKSGRDFERNAYRRLLKKLRKGDLLVIKSIDRLGRNYDQIIAEWARIVNDIGADILVLDMPLLDTRTKADTLIGKFISDIVLQVLSFVAENERANIRARQAEGIRVAMIRGVRFGRPKAVYSKQFISAAEAYLLAKKTGAPISLKSAAALAGMKLSVFHYHYQHYLASRRDENLSALPFPRAADAQKNNVFPK